MRGGYFDVRIKLRKEKVYDINATLSRERLDA